MTHYQKALAVAVLAVLGIWGCAQGPAGGASVEKMKSLEAKVTRLEDDFRAATAARDQFRKKLADTEAAAAELRREVDALRPVVKERDDLLVQLRVRTTERDALNHQFEAFRKGLKELIGQTEAALTKPAAPPTSTVSKPKAPNL